MKAVIPTENISNARNYSGEKETTCRYIVIGKVKGKLQSVVEARMYMGRSKEATTVYCSLWVHGDDVYCSGSGKAGGYGYHKESAALAAAISSAGIELYGSNYSFWDKDVKPDYKQKAYIGGCGSGSMETALKAMAKAVGAKGELLIV